MFAKVLGHPVYNRPLEVGIKVLLGLIFIVKLYYTITGQQDLAKIYHSFQASLEVSRIPLLGSVSLLMIINWWLESSKWQMLMRPLERLTILGSLKAVFCSTLLGLLPNIVLTGAVVSAGVVTFTVRVSVEVLPAPSETL